MATELTVTLEEVAKRFGRQWILQNCNQQFTSGVTYGIRGRNGSGKSTLLRLLAGQLSPSRGRIIHQKGGSVLKADDLYREVSWTGPYLEIIEELTVSEMLRFHFSLKPALPGIDPDSIIDRIELATAKDRALSECSSGMRQRVLLATALYANTSLLLLDEPTVTLDEAAASWFQRELSAVKRDRLVIIASNDQRDLQACQHIITL